MTETEPKAESISAEPKAEPISPPWPDTDPDPAIHGVLLSNYIKKYSQDYGLIAPFEEKSLDAASYKLHVGEDFWVDDKRVWPDASGDVKIPPNGLLYFSIKEKLRLPRFLIAIHDLKVKEVYRGLLVGRSVSVDPGYSGHINYPIFNFTSQDRSLHVGDEIGTIIFVKTTPFTADCIKFKDLPDNRSIEVYWRPYETHSSAVLQLQNHFKRLKAVVRNKVKNLEAVIQRIKTLGYIAAIALAVTIMIGIFEEIRWVADKVDTLSQRIAAHESELADAKHQIDTQAAKLTATQARIDDQLRVIEARINAVTAKPPLSKKSKP